MKSGLSKKVRRADHFSHYKSLLLSDELLSPLLAERITFPADKAGLEIL